MGEDRSLSGVGRVEGVEWVVRCFGAVGAPLSVTLVSVMAERAEAEVSVAFTRLRQGGMLELVEPGWYAPTDDLPPSPAEGATGSRARLVDHLVGGEPWAAGEVGGGGVRAVVEAALSWGSEGELAPAVCDLVVRLWEVTLGCPVLLEDAVWRGRLVEAGERAARASGNPVRLGAVRDRAGRACGAAGDRLMAESQLVRAAQVWQEVHDEGRVDSTLRELVRLHSSTGRWAQALDAAFVLLDTHRGREQRVATARTLALIGDLMGRAERPDAALDYWQQAEHAFADAARHDPDGAGAGAVAGERAAVLTAVGRARWERGEHRSARDTWHTALSLLVDHDEVGAEQVRRLLRLREGDPLPPA